MYNVLEKHQGGMWRLNQVRSLSVVLREEVSLLYAKLKTTEDQLIAAMREKDMAEDETKLSEAIRHQQERHIKMLQFKLMGSGSSTASMESGTGSMERSLSLERQVCLNKCASTSFIIILFYDKLYYDIMYDII